MHFVRTHVGSFLILCCRLGLRRWSENCFFVSYSRALQICINLFEGAQLALDHCETRMLRHMLRDESCTTLSQSLETFGSSPNRLLQNLGKALRGFYILLGDCAESVIEILRLDTTQPCNDFWWEFFFDLPSSFSQDLP